MESIANTVIESIAEAILVVNAKGEIVHANARAIAMFGYSREELRGCMVELLMPERFRLRHAEYRTGFSNSTSLRMMGANQDLYALRKDGSEFPVEVGLGPFRIDDDQFIVVSLNDISKRKQIEFQAKWCEAIVQSAGDAIISKSPEGIVTSWNAKAQDMFGYTANEIIGRSLLVLFPDDRVAEEHAILARIHRGETVSNFETVRRHKYGQPIEVSVTISPIYDEKKQVVGASKIVRDITAQKNAERVIKMLSQERDRLLTENTIKLQLTEDILQERTNELRNTLYLQAENLRRKVEEERRRVSQDFHDEVGQLLMALNLNLEMVRRKSKDPAADQPLINAMQITEDIVKSVRRIVNQLRPPQLDELGLIAALRWHLDNVRGSSPATINLSENLGAKRVHPDIELGIFRIVQEALTNVLRHASASHIEVRLAYESNQLNLSVRDDGVGFVIDDSAIGGIRIGHFGIQGMRERARSMGGGLGVVSAPGNGCEISVEIPLDIAGDMPRDDTHHPG